MRLWPQRHAVQQAPAQQAQPQVMHTWQAQHWPRRSLREDLATAQRLSLIHACIEARANSIASLTPELWSGDRQIEGPPARVLVEPALATDAISWWRTFWRHHDATGNVYLYRDTTSGRMNYRLLRPDRVRIMGARGVVTGYRYDENAGANVAMVGQGVLLEPDAVAHFRSPDLSDDYYGLGPVGILAREARLDEDATTFSVEWLMNKGRSPGGILSSAEPDLLDSEVTRIKQLWRAVFAGGAGDIAVLPGSLQYQPLSAMEASEMPGLRALTESRICGVFGVDGRIVGANYAVQASSGTADFAVARRVFWEDTLLPIYKRVAAFMGRTLTADLGMEVDWRWDTSGVAALRESEDAVSDRVLAQWEAGLITLDEARAALGREPVGGEHGARWHDDDLGGALPEVAS